MTSLQRGRLKRPPEPYRKGLACLLSDIDPPRGKKELFNNIYNAIFNAGITFKTRGRVGPR
jgi:hypothetical protein